MSWNDIDTRIKRLPKWAQAHIEALESEARVRMIPATVIFLDAIGGECPVEMSFLALPRAGELITFEDTDRSVRRVGRAIKPRHHDLDGEIGITIRTQRP